MKKILHAIVLLSILGCIGTVAFLLLAPFETTPEDGVVNGLLNTEQEKASSTIPGIQKEHQRCQILEGGAVFIEDDLETYSCDYELKQNEGIATLHYSMEEIRIESNGKVLTTFKCEREDDYGNPCRSGGFRIIIADITYDGYVDFGVTSWCGAYQCAFSYYAFNPSQGLLLPIDVLTDITEPFIDSSLRTITSHSKGRGIGDMFIIETFAFNNGQYELVKSCEQDTINHEDPETDYSYICKEKQGDTMATTTYKIIPASEVWE